MILRRVPSSPLGPQPFHEPHKIRRQQSLVNGGGEQNQTLLLLTESLEALRLADSTLLSAANGLGWIGTGTLTYAAREDNLMAEGNALDEMSFRARNPR